MRCQRGCGADDMYMDSEAQGGRAAEGGAWTMFATGRLSAAAKQPDVAGDDSVLIILELGGREEETLEGRMGGGPLSTPRQGLPDVRGP